MQIWDTAGQERFRGIASSYYRLCLGVIIVYDISNQETFDNLDFWFEEVLTYADEHVEMVLVGNKKDLVGRREVRVEDGIDSARKRNISFYEISALDNKNNQIETVFQELCQRIMLNADLHSKIPSSLGYSRKQDTNELSKGSQRKISLELTDKTRTNPGFMRKNCC